MSAEEPKGTSPGEESVGIAEKAQGIPFFIAVFALVAGAIGALMIWITTNKVGGPSAYPGTMLFIAIAINIVGYFLSQPALFAVTYAFVLAFLPTVITLAESFRPALGLSADLDAYYAGSIIVGFSVLLSFVCYPVTEKNFTMGLPLIKAAIASLLFLIGGSLHAAAPIVPTAVLLFLMIPFPIAAVVLASKSLQYGLLFFAAFMFQILIGALGGGSDLAIAGAVFGWMGCVVSVATVLFIVHVQDQRSDV